MCITFGLKIALLWTVGQKSSVLSWSHRSCSYKFQSWSRKKGNLPEVGKRFLGEERMSINYILGLAGSRSRHIGGNASVPATVGHLYSEIGRSTSCEQGVLHLDVVMLNSPQALMPMCTKPAAHIRSRRSPCQRTGPELVRFPAGPMPTGIMMSAHTVLQATMPMDLARSC